MRMLSRSKHGLISAGTLQLSGTFLTSADRSEKHASSQGRWGTNNSEWPSYTLQMHQESLERSCLYEKRL